MATPRKLRLDPDALNVSSFSTLDHSGEEGTVIGHGTPVGTLRMVPVVAGITLVGAALLAWKAKADAEAEEEEARREEERRKQEAKRK